MKKTNQISKKLLKELEENSSIMEVSESKIFDDTGAKSSFNLKNKFVWIQKFKNGFRFFLFTFTRTTSSRSLLRVEFIKSELVSILNFELLFFRIL